MAGRVSRRVVQHQAQLFEEDARSAAGSSFLRLPSSMLEVRTRPLQRGMCTLPCERIAACRRWRSVAVAVAVVVAAVAAAGEAG
jgi:hypothetical protein